ncbi:hypothetical protein BDV24DRAFT_121819 [Aspergillus arachidicola]|uniref:Uncharacterized protein n=1 Tax=Aspergillus arachidicola TaxID=656916 RepID=A0A5N6YQV4_9EURO|nr:hypothetical protein BDV24DRAFT_121819 [Aspergillus arachidicola]
MIWLIQVQELKRYVAVRVCFENRNPLEFSVLSRETERELKDNYDTSGIRSSEYLGSEWHTCPLCDNTGKNESL